MLRRPGASESGSGNSDGDDQSSSPLRFSSPEPEDTDVLDAQAPLAPIFGKRASQRAGDKEGKKRPLPPSSSSSASPVSISAFKTTPKGGEEDNLRKAHKRRKQRDRDALAEKKKTAERETAQKQRGLLDYFSIESRTAGEKDQEAEQQFAAVTAGTSEDVSGPEPGENTIAAKAAAIRQRLAAAAGDEGQDGDTNTGVYLWAAETVARTVVDALGRHAEDSARALIAARERERERDADGGSDAEQMPEEKTRRSRPTTFNLTDAQDEYSQSLAADFGSLAGDYSSVGGSLGASAALPILSTANVVRKGNGPCVSCTRAESRCWTKHMLGAGFVCELCAHKERNAARQFGTPRTPASWDMLSCVDDRDDSKWVPEANRVMTQGFYYSLAPGSHLHVAALMMEATRHLTEPVAEDDVAAAWDRVLDRRVRRDVGVVGAVGEKEKG
jgi:hypothetical protein